ncbi:MAG TPA: winged helix-turn-helix domain-containing protein [Nitrososphaera sp.]
MINRARRDIAADILEATNGRTNRTSIMYGSFLFYTMVKEYFNLAAVQAADL